MNLFKAKPQNSPAELIAEKLNSGHQILPFPQVVGQLLNALKDPNVSSAALAKIIESDAALTVRLLRMANSPVYGNSNVIESVARATTVLGLGPLKNIALTFAASTVFSGGAQAAKQRELLWHHALGCATSARYLAKFVGTVNPDDAFLAGIFHDVGKLFFYDAIPDVYSELAKCDAGQRLIEREEELLGTTHEAVGVKLLTAWQLPEKLMIAVGFHHQPKNAIAHGELACVIHVADALARQAGVGSQADAGIDVVSKAEEFYQLNNDGLAIVREQALDAFEETKQACSV